MAQNNYIDFIKNTVIENDLSNQPSVLDPSIYTNLKSHSLMTECSPSTKLVYSKLVAPNTQRIFNMDISANNCVLFNTNTRINKVLHPPQLPSPIKPYIKSHDKYILSADNTRKCICLRNYAKCRTRICKCA
jgi:hypothetical protein